VWMRRIGGGCDTEVDGEHERNRSYAHALLRALWHCCAVTASIATDLASSTNTTPSAACPRRLTSSPADGPVAHLQRMYVVERLLRSVCISSTEESPPDPGAGRFTDETRDITARAVRSTANKV